MQVADLFSRDAEKEAAARTTLERCLIKYRRDPRKQLQLAQEEEGGEEEEEERAKARVGALLRAETLRPASNRDGACMCRGFEAVRAAVAAAGNVERARVFGGITLNWVDQFLQTRERQQREADEAAAAGAPRRILHRAAVESLVTLHNELNLVSEALRAATCAAANAAGDGNKNVDDGGAPPAPSPVLDRLQRAMGEVAAVFALGTERALRRCFCGLAGAAGKASHSPRTKGRLPAPAAATFGGATQSNAAGGASFAANAVANVLAPVASSIAQLTSMPSREVLMHVLRESAFNALLATSAGPAIVAAAVRDDVLPAAPAGNATNAGGGAATRTTTTTTTAIIKNYGNNLPSDALAVARQLQVWFDMLMHTGSPRCNAPAAAAGAGAHHDDG